jgi:hypothetical protein
MISGQDNERPRGGNAVFQFLLQHQRQEAAEDMAAKGLVEFVEDRPGDEQVFGGAEGLLHRPQLLVAEHGFERIEVGVGVQDEDAVELRFLGHLVGIDSEAVLADRLV